MSGSPPQRSAVCSPQATRRPALAPLACTGRAKPVVTASRVHFSYNATVNSPAMRIAAILLSTRFPSGACAPLLLGYLFPRTRRTRLTSSCRKTRFMELKARDFATIEALNEATSTAESGGTTQEVVEHRCVCRMGVDRRGGGGKTRGERSQAQPRRRRAHKGDGLRGMVHARRVQAPGASNRRLWAVAGARGGSIIQEGRHARLRVVVTLRESILFALSW